MIMVWFITNLNHMLVRNNSYKLNSYTICLYLYYNTHLFFLKMFVHKQIKNYFLFSRWSYSSILFNFMYYTKVINIKYIGKIFKIKKFKKLLILTFNYPIFKYLIWNNIKLKWQKKPKRVFFFFSQTYSNLFNMFYFNLIYLRPLNTYTTRGIYNNLFYYNKRKKKVTNKR